MRDEIAKVHPPSTVSVKECTGNHGTPLYFVIPAKERVKKPDGLTNTRHSRESGNLLRRFRNKNEPI